MAALGASWCWAASIVLSSVTSARLGTLVVNRLRLTFATMFLGLAVIGTGGFVGARMDLGQLSLLCGSGIIGLYLGDQAYLESLRALGVRVASAVMFLWPIPGAVLGWLFLGEGLSPLGAVGMAVALASATFVAAQRDTRHPSAPGAASSKARGIVFALLFMLGQSVGFVMAKRAMQGTVDPLLAGFVRAATATVAIWAVGIIVGQARTTVSAALSDRRTTLMIAAGAFVSQFLATWLSLVAAKHASVALGGTIMATVPLWVALLGALVLGDRLSARALLGSAGVVIGIACLFLGSR